jgi:Uma2 family endonuclease
MNAPTSRLPWTYEEYAALPDDGNRYEVLDGEVLVTPSPSPHHQRVLFRLARCLHDYVERHGLGEVFMDVDVLFAKGQFLRPDLVFIPADRSDGVSVRGIELAPGLVVEVPSPGSSKIDRVKKPARYGDFGIPEYWVLDPAAGVVLIWRFAEGAVGATLPTGRFEWHPAGAPEPLVLGVEALFRQP